MKNSPSAAAPILFGAVTLSYGELLRKLPDADVARLHLSHGRLVWYLILAQLFSRGIGFGVQDLQVMIRNGMVEVAMLRPAPFWSLTLAEWTGRQCMQLLFMLPLAVTIGYGMSGMIPFSAHDFLMVPACASCLFCGLCLSFLMGGSVLWFSEGAPLYWIFQKLALILGGMLCPIAI